MDTNAIGIALSIQKQLNALSEVVQALSGGLHYRGAVQHYSDLASLTPEIGDCYTVLDNGQEYAWGEISSTAQWIPIGIEYESKQPSQGGTDVSLVTTGEKYTWNSKQDALATQTAYTQKGTASKVPQITTNNLGQVTGITEVDIAKELPTTTGLSDGVYFIKLTMLNGTPTLEWSDAYYDGSVT